jgi:hypothetical protein
MILDLYYKIWVDGIVKLRSRQENKGVWKFYAMIFISLAMAMNLVLFMVILQEYILKHWFYDINIDIGKSRSKGFLKFFILYGAFPVLINYLLIFKNNRYEALIKKYKYYNGKLFVWYIMVSYFFPFILLIIAYIYLKLTGKLQLSLGVLK